MRRQSLALLPRLSILHTSSPAHAEGLSLDMLVGWGQSTPAPNVHGPGAGVRLGYTFATPWYVGAGGLFHLGSQEGAGRRHRAEDAGVEIGYAITAGALVLRPTVRGGVAWVKTWHDVNDGFFSPYVGLGTTSGLSLDRWLFGLDVDARVYNRLVDEGDSAYGIGGLGAYLLAGRSF